MSQRKSAWLRTVVPAAVLALAVTGCGSDDSGDDDAAAQPSEEQTQEEAPEDEGAEDEAPEEAPEDEAGEDDGGEGAVQEGELSYALGETSEPIPYEEALMSATADRVDVGENADIQDGLFDAEDIEGMKPAFVHVTFAHAGGESLDYASPINSTSLFLADGSRATPVISIGDLGIEGGCPDGSDDSVSFAEGDEAAMCTMFLIPEDAEPDQVRWYPEDVDVRWSLNG